MDGTVLTDHEDLESVRPLGPGAGPTLPTGPRYVKMFLGSTPIPAVVSPLGTPG